MSREIEYQSASEADTDRLGGLLAEVVPSGTTLALSGTLGAGKTRLVQALALACGIARENVTSPTFVLCQHYQGTKTIYHLDAYRIQDDDEFLELGVDEYFESDGITVIEWADRVATCLPRSRIEIDIQVKDGTARTVRLRAHGTDCEVVLSQIEARLTD